MSVSAAPVVARKNATGPHSAKRGRRELAAASLGALGVVYGDIGTSPLYAMKECLAYPHSPHAIQSTAATLEGNVLGIVSLVTWALILVICLKYLVFVLRADNKGEGGILALAALVEPEHGKKRIGIALLLALFGAGLLFGDGVITPAISVLGALEGLSEQSPALTRLIVPLTIAILIGLFMVQRHGTGRIGRVFGWVVLVWFVAIGTLGAIEIAAEPSVLRAINPVYGVQFLATHGYHGFVIVGLVFLVVTGGEALYADMGHFGRTPIRIAWFAVAFPGLLLNYYGQGALFIGQDPSVIGTENAIANPFYELAGGWTLIPMLILALMAAIIASQALISGVFSITRQAIQLGFWPRLTVKHTSEKMEGQIYVPEMNYILMFGCVALVLAFKTSSGLAAAYGIAVTATMGITTFLFYRLCVVRWNVKPSTALLFLIPFLAIDVSFLAANAIKITDGGWFPLAVGAVVFAIMTTWWRGRADLARIVEAGGLPDDLFLADLETAHLPRVRGTAVFMSSTPEAIPNVLLHHVKHNQVLHKQVVLLSIVTAPAPWVAGNSALSVKELDHGFFRVVARVGFMQTPDVPRLLARCEPYGLSFDEATTTYYLGRQTLLTTGKARMARWRKLLFSFLMRNARPPTAFFNLPPNRVVELGLQIEL
jgi:KUP system potassium uptake protein